MGGSGAGNSNSIITGGGRDLSAAVGQRDSGDTERTTKEIGAQMARAELARKEQERIEALERKINTLIDSNEKLVSKQGALQEAEVKLAQSVTAFRRDTARGTPTLAPTVAETQWTDRNGTHHYLVDTFTTRARAGW